MDNELKAGLCFELKKTVEDSDTAVHMGSGGIKVLSTPTLISWMENAALNAVKPYLCEDEDTVGVHVNIKHLAATPVGMEVCVSATLEKAEGRMLYFKTEAFDGKEKVGEGSHTRAVINTERFLKKVLSKTEK